VVSQLGAHGQKAARGISGGGVPSAFAGSYGGTSVLNRGDRREAIFRTDEDRELFLKQVKLACRPRRETTMSLNWMAKRLNMGAAGSLANRLRQAGGKRI
jgi:hypothetical protein